MSTAKGRAVTRITVNKLSKHVNSIHSKQVIVSCSINHLLDSPIQSRRSLQFHVLTT